MTFVFWQDLGARQNSYPFPDVCLKLATHFKSAETIYHKNLMDTRRGVALHTKLKLQVDIPEGFGVFRLFCTNLHTVIGRNGQFTVFWIDVILVWVGVCGSFEIEDFCNFKNNLL